MASNQDLIHFGHAGYPITTGLISQFKNWAMIWMYSSTTKQRSSLDEKRVDQVQEEMQQPLAIEKPLYLDKGLLYNVTYQKLRPSNKRYLLSMGAIIQVRKCWDTLEEEIYQELSHSPHYIPPSKRLPFNPDRMCRKRTMRSHKRRSFASSTFVYISSGSMVRILPIQVTRDDDDVPLGELLTSNSNAPHLRD